MTQGYVAGFDVGTTSTKGVVLDPTLAIAASARTEHSVNVLKPGFVEQDAGIWCDDIIKICAQLKERVTLSHVRAVGISSMCPTVLPVSVIGEPLRPASVPDDINNNTAI